MDKFQQATTDQLYFRDPDIEPPPKGTSMLLLNPAGVCIIGVWDDSCIGWCPKPKIPKSLKEKHSEQHRTKTERDDYVVHAQRHRGAST